MQPVASLNCKTIARNRSAYCRPRMSVEVPKPHCTVTHITARQMPASHLEHMYVKALFINIYFPE